MYRFLPARVAPFIANNKHQNFKFLPLRLLGKENARFLYYHLSVERINARVSRDFQLEHHYMRGLETMQMRVALSLSVMLAMACMSIREGQPQRMRSLILPLAA